MNAELFWSKVERSEGCWNWQGRRQPFGYGQFDVARKPQAAHRVAFCLTYGPVSKGLCVLHHCDNPSCVRPDHLFVGTRADNQRDMVAKGRSTKGRLTHALPPLRGADNPRAKVSMADVLAIRAAHATGVGFAQIARQWGISPSQAERIAKGQNWSLAG